MPHANKAEVGSLLFIQEDNKRRPYVCVQVFYNKTGVPYNWLVLPITSSTSVGESNLFQITHPKLTKTSYAKINNMKTIPWDDDIEIKSKIDMNTLDQLKNKIKQSLDEYIERKTPRGLGQQESKQDEHVRLEG